MREGTMSDRNGNGASIQSSEGVSGHEKRVGVIE